MPTTDPESRSANGTRVRSSDRRITTTIKTVEVGNVFVPIVGLACQQWLEPVYGREIEWFEWPDVLKYGPGGRYDLHAGDRLMAAEKDAEYSP